MGHPSAPSDPEPRFVELATGPAAYCDEGEGPVIVLVHGLPGSVRDFRWLAPALSPSFRVLRLDLPGFGSTPWATGPDYTPPGRAACVVEFIRALELGPTIVVGHSMGGAVATAAALAAPDLVRAVGLLATPGLRPHKGFRRMPRHVLSRLFSKPRPYMMPLTRFMFRQLGFRGPYSDEALIHTLHGVAAMDFAGHADRLRALDRPTAHFWCEDDPLIEADISSELGAELQPGPRGYFATGGHNPQKHWANEIADALRDWKLDP